MRTSAPSDSSDTVRCHSVACHLGVTVLFASSLVYAIASVIDHVAQRVSHVIPPILHQPLPGEEPGLVREGMVEEGNVLEGRHRFEQVKADHRAPHASVGVVVFVDRKGIQLRNWLGVRFGPAPPFAFARCARSLRQFADIFLGAEALFYAEHRAGVLKVIVGRGKANDVGARVVIVERITVRYGRAVPLHVCPAWRHLLGQQRQCPFEPNRAGLL